MSAAAIEHEVLTLDEAAIYLRLSEEILTQEALKGRIPGKQVGNTWRFLRRALDEWLGARDSRAALLRQAGALSDDAALPALLSTIYASRGRAEHADTEADASS